MPNGSIRRNQGESSCLDTSVDAEPLEIKTGTKGHSTCTTCTSNVHFLDDLLKILRYLSIIWLDYMT